VSHEAPHLSPYASPIDFDFVVRCHSCTVSSRFSLSYLGLQVRCPSCARKLVATDRDLESAAGDEAVADFAKIIDWEERLTKFEPRPR